MLQSLQTLLELFFLFSIFYFLFSVFYSTEEMYFSKLFKTQKVLSEAVVHIKGDTESAIYDNL